MEIKYKIWLESDCRVVFGQGRRELLEAIDECRSLNAAAKKLSMSYRAAWGRLKASEERLGFKLVDHVAGEAMRLTEEGRVLLAEFKALDEQIKALVQEAGPKFQRPGSAPPPRNAQKAKP